MSGDKVTQELLLEWRKAHLKIKIRRLNFKDSEDL